MGNEHDELKRWLSELVGKECWAAVAGPGTGSMVSFQIGRKIQRRRPLRANSRLTEELQRFEGEYWFFLRGCAWRLERNGRILCGSTSSNGPGEELEQGLAQLIPTTILSYAVTGAASDLTLYFDSGGVLSVFSDQLSEYDNYSIGNHLENSVSVGPRGVIRCER